MRVAYGLHLFVIAALIAGCGASTNDEGSTVPASRLEKINVALDGHVSPANVAIRIAERRGYFADVGLDVSATDPAYRLPIAYLTNEVDDFGLTQEPQAVMGKARKAPIVAVGSVISKPSASLIWLKRSGIDGIASLAGRTIAIPGVSFQIALLNWVLVRHGLTLRDVHVKRVGYQLVPFLLKGRVDAIFGGSWNIEGIALEERGAQPVITRIQHLGVPDYEELVVITTSERARDDPQSVRAFMSAVTRALNVVENKVNVAKKWIDGDLESSPEVDMEMADAQYRATRPLISATGRIDLRKAADLTAWMYSEGVIKEEVPARSLFTNKFLAQP